MTELPSESDGSIACAFGPVTGQSTDSIASGDSTGCFPDSSEEGLRCSSFHAGLLVSLVWKTKEKGGGSRLLAPAGPSREQRPIPTGRYPGAYHQQDGRR